MPRTKSSEFALRGSPTEWSAYALELKQAMDLLWSQESDRLIVGFESVGEKVTKKRQVSRTWLLLAAFALENLLKGIHVAENPCFISNGRLSPNLKHHKLTILGTSAKNLNITTAEVKFLGILEDALPYWGRYPIPLGMEDLRQERYLTPSLRTRFESLFKWLDRHLYGLLKNGWNGPHQVKLKAHVRSEMEPLPKDFMTESFDETTDRIGRRRKVEKGTAEGSGEGNLS